MENLQNQDKNEPEYKTFKQWFVLMAKNNYITVFLLGLAFLIYSIVQFEPTVGSVVLLIIPIAMLSATVYKGFYQFWKDSQNKRTR
jgi:hypothetical protein